MTHASSPRDAQLDCLEARLMEACGELWDRYVDPREALFDGDGARWLPLAGEGGEALAACATEHEHRDIRQRCRGLALSNEFAINGHENRVSYIVGAGHSYRVAPRKHVRPDEPMQRLAASVQSVLDAFLWQNQWHRRQQESVLRRDRDGEVFLRFFPSADGSLRVRFVEPGQIGTPPQWSADPAASFGVLTDRDDVESPLAYFIDGQPVPAEQVQHRKANVDGNVKRGLPLFFPVRKNLRRAEKLLRNMSVVAEIQSAIALIRKHRSGTRSAVQQFVSQGADASIAAPSGATTHFKRYGPGAILDTSAGIEYDFPAAGLNAGAYVTVLQAELRAIASRLVMPEFMLSSDASNTAYASTMIAEGPAVKMFERLQAQQVADDLEVLWRAVEVATRAGRLPEGASDQVEIQAVPPSLAVRDTLREAQVSRIEHEAGILSPQTWSQRRGLDYDQEQANRRAGA